MDIKNEMNMILQAPCGIFTADRGMNILSWNNEMEQITGISASLALSQKFSFIKFYNINQVGKVLLDFKECFRGKRANIAKTAFVDNPELGQVLVFINARFISVGNEDLLIIFITDISREITCSTASAAPLIIKEKEALQRIVGRDEKILELYRMIEMAADSIANVNISGESGTGKELVANAIHLLSSRKNKPFITVNCSALTETLLESELFGHVKGSFTGAYKDKIGKFEASGGGTIFLDEIGEISQMIQVKLLRVIQEKIIERVGGNKPVKVDMRIITATNKNLRELVNKGLFREDLFYRLNVFPIRMPSLRERMKDIPLLVDHFITRFNNQTGKHIKGLSEDAYRIIMDYNWPGNVRELENSIEHAFVVCNEKLIDIFDLPQDIRHASLSKPVLNYGGSPDVFSNENHPAIKQVAFRIITREQLENALYENQFNRKLTAEKLGVSTVSLWNKMKKFGLIK